MYAVEFISLPADSLDVSIVNQWVLCIVPVIVDPRYSTSHIVS